MRKYEKDINRKGQSFSSRSIYPKVDRCLNVTIPFSKLLSKVGEGVLSDFKE